LVNDVWPIAPAQSCHERRFTCRGKECLVFEDDRGGVLAREGPSPRDSAHADLATGVGVRWEADSLVVALRGEWELERPAPRFDRLIEEIGGERERRGQT
jgi:hypothetical protein